MFRVEFHTDDAALEENFEYEVDIILRKIASQCALGILRGNILDSNGNRVGSWSSGLDV